MFHKKGVLRNFVKSTGKHLCQSHFSNKVAGLSMNFVKLLRTPFCKEHLCVTASGMTRKYWHTAQKMKFSVKDFFIFCAVTVLLFHYYKPHKDDVNCNIKKIILDLSSGKKQHIHSVFVCNRVIVLRVLYFWALMSFILINWFTRMRCKFLIQYY